MNKSTNLTYYQRNKDMVLNKAKDYHKNKEKLREQARDKYRKLSEEEKVKKREYGKTRYYNMSEEKKNKLKEYQKEYQKKYQKSYCEANKIIRYTNNELFCRLYLLKLFFIINIRFGLIIRVTI